MHLEQPAGLDAEGGKAPEQAADLKAAEAVRLRVRPGLYAAQEGGARGDAQQRERAHDHRQVLRPHPLHAVVQLPQQLRAAQGGPLVGKPTGGHPAAWAPSAQGGAQRPRTPRLQHSAGRMAEFVLLGWMPAHERYHWPRAWVRCVQQQGVSDSVVRKSSLFLVTQQRAPVPFPNHKQQLARSAGAGADAVLIRIPRRRTA